MFYPIDIPKEYYTPTAEIHQENNISLDFNSGIKIYFDSKGKLFINELEKNNCKIVNEEEIVAFINKNLDVFDNTLSTINKIKNIFNNNKIIVELFENPEEINAKKELFINIVSKIVSKNDEDFKNFYSLEEWFIENIYKHNNKININIIFE